MMLKFKAFRSEKGVTYVEVVMGVFLLIFLIALFVIFTDGVNMVRMAKERNQGMSVAQQKMEELQDLGWNEPDLSLNDEGNPDDAHTGTETRGGRQYNLRWRVTRAELDGQRRDDVKQIEITVTWTDGGTNRTASLVTYRQQQM